VLNGSQKLLGVFKIHELCCEDYHFLLGGDFGLLGQHVDKDFKSLLAKLCNDLADNQVSFRPAFTPTFVSHTRR